MQYTISFFCAIFLCGCASWIEGNRHHEKPVSTTPIAWFQEIEQSFTGALIKAGYSEADITPAEQQWLSGYPVGRRSKSVQNLMRAQCLALEDERGEKLMIVALDLLGVLPPFIDGILRQVRSWPTDRILFSCSHTHSAPDTYGIWGNGLGKVPLLDGKDYRYMAHIQTQVALAIEAAASGMRPARMRFGEGKAPTGISRGREGNIPDQTISLLQISFGSHTVTVFNYALHPNLMKGKYLTPDFVHFLRQRFEARSGGRLLFIPAAIGGVQPQRRSKQSQKVPRISQNWYRAREIGELLADRGIEILHKPIVPADSNITVHRSLLPIHMQGKLFRLGMALGMLPDIVDDDYRAATEVFYVEIGPAKILTAPGELFPERWHRIKQKLRGKPKFLFGLSNVALGYILSKRDYFSGNHDYHASMSVGWKIGEDIIDVYEELLSVSAGKSRK